jgi:hypothetical protein
VRARLDSGVPVSPAWSALARAAVGALSLAAAATMAACGQPAASPERSANRLRSVTHPGKPPLALVARAGDPASGMAAAILTDGIAPARSTTVAWSLATLLASRLPNESVVPASEGLRIRGRAHGAAEVTRFFTAVREALAAPVTAGEADTVARKLAATSRAPDPVAEISAMCQGTALPRSATAATGGAALDRATLESWRTDAYALGRVSLAIVGSESDVKAADDLLTREAAWPAERVAAKVDGPVVPGDQVYVRTAGAADILARIDVAVPTETSAEAVALASSLGAEGGALAARLGALDPPATLALVSATAHPGGGCVALTVTVSPNDVGGRPSDVDLAARIGSAVAVTTQEIGVEAARPAANGSESAAVSPEELARREGDARDAADVAAWWTLADTVAPASTAPKEHGARAERVVVGVTPDRDVGPGRDASAGRDAAAAGTSLVARVGAEVDRARAASGAAVAEVHSRVERGQGETWVLVASPCAGVDEGSGDAGLAAAVTLAEVSAPTADGADGVTVEPWTAIDGVGVIAHGHPRAGESPEAAARRIADVAARRFAATPLDGGAIVRARSALFAAADTVPARALAAVAAAVSPGRPSWLVPQGTATSLGRASDAEVAARATALRTGPLRVAILAAESEAQVTAATQAIDRWMLRHPAGDRACPQVPSPPPPRPGTYTVPLPRGSAAAEAWLALPLPDHDRLAFASATWLADALDGEGGLLERALVTAGLVRSADARVVGSLVRGRAALALRLDAPPGSLDAAVAQTRALLDRLREGALTEADLTRASARHAAATEESCTTPRGRLVELFRERDPDTNLPAPSLLAWRAFAASAIKDGALIIVVARPAEKSEPVPTSAASAVAPAPGAKPAPSASHR